MFQKQGASGVQGTQPANYQPMVWITRKRKKRKTAEAEDSLPTLMKEKETLWLKRAVSSTTRLQT
eukprot:1139424-Pelagomonas_calceolata.AAC.1